jgi:hypothetical protein
MGPIAEAKGRQSQTPVLDDSALGLGYTPYGREKAEVLVDCATYVVCSSVGSTSAASRSPTSPAGASTARWTRSASTPRRSTAAPAEQAARGGPRVRPRGRGCSPPRVSGEPARRRSDAPVGEAPAGIARKAGRKQPPTEQSAP